MLGYLADFAAGSLNIDPVEIRAARWFRYDQLPSARPPMTTIAGQLIDLFIQQRSSLKNHNKS
jgi:NAD+ diphosphatase